MKQLVEILEDLGVNENEWLEFGELWRKISSKEVSISNFLNSV